MRLPVRSLHGASATGKTPKEGEGTGAAKVGVTPVAGSVTVIALSGLPSHSRGQRAPLAGIVGTPGSGTGYTRRMPSAAAKTTPSPSIWRHSSRVDIQA